MAIFDQKADLQVLFFAQGFHAQKTVKIEKHLLKQLEDGIHKQRITMMEEILK